MIVVTAHARVKPEARERAIAAARRMRDASRQEAGCQEYGFWFSFDDENELLVFERWDDQAALDAHFQTPHLAEFAQAIPTFVDGTPDVRRLVVEDESPGPLSGQGA